MPESMIVHWLLVVCLGFSVGGAAGFVRSGRD